MGYGINYQIG